MSAGRPIAWLMRETDPDGGRPRVMSGRIWLSEESARAAALRMRSQHWKREPFPVFEPTPEQLAGLRR